jgi:hypothetical protein
MMAIQNITMVIRTRQIVARQTMTGSAVSVWFWSETWSVAPMGTEKLVT